ncbi:MAG: 2-oxo acid dehydrogenase subunit E2 [Firmicutes bacterium]|nr:2-oxo acid dehydrogenase subunit E2 [Bacillota bacterium]
MSDNTPRRRGDRKDGRLLRDLDGMHFIMPIIYPNRCDNEAFVSEKIDLTAAEEYLARKNAENPEFRYTLFHLVVTAAIRVITVRPKLNRFIANRNTYQRNEVSASFVIKKQFADESHEGLAFIHATDQTDLEEVHSEIFRQVTDCRGGKIDSSSDSMDMFNRMPRFLGKAIVRFICFLDRHGWVPSSLIETDPYYSSVVLTNLGSIRLHSGYHHLTNWGTNSVFVIVGEKKKRPFFSEDGSFEMRPSIDLGLTVDERIADGYYFSKTVRIIRHLIEHPELLEQPACTPVDLD